jgi:hypothetical protein
VLEGFFRQPSEIDHRYFHYWPVAPPLDLYGLLAGCIGALPGKREAGRPLIHHLDLHPHQRDASLSLACATCRPVEDDGGEIPRKSLTELQAPAADRVRRR